MFEYVFGIRPQARERRIRWDLRLLEKHGIMNYPLGDLTVDLICEKRQNRDDEPIVTVRCDQPVEVELCYGNKTKIIRASGQN
jgi:hypothetical protein